MIKKKKADLAAHRASECSAALKETIIYLPLLVFLVFLVM